jgi:hypothetical protein
VHNLSLVDTTTGQQIPVTWTSSEHILIIEPDTLNHAIENQHLEAVVTGIEDLYGNAMSDSIRWAFTVDRNPLYWEKGQLSYVKYPDNASTISAALHNRGGHTANYEITDLPAWLTASPQSGEIVSNSYAIVLLTIGEFINYGVYTDTLYAHGAEGDEPLILRMRTISTR